VDSCGGDGAGEEGTVPRHSAAAWVRPVPLRPRRAEFARVATPPAV